MPTTVRFTAAAAGVLLAAMAAACGGGGGNNLTGPTSASISVPDPSGATSLTYTANIAPIVQSDCLVCHSSSVRSGGYDLSSYSGVMRAVSPGNPASIIVQVTQPGGLMYSMLRSSASEKSATIRRWVVDFHAAQ